MSGSDGGGGGGWGGPDHGSCESLAFETQIATPQAAQIGSLKVGDVLDVAIVSITGAQVVAVQKQGITIGGLAGGLVNKLRECLLGGTKYSATIVAINGGQIKVSIESA